MLLKGGRAVCLRGPKAYTEGVEEQQEDRRGLSSYAKAGAYAGLAFVTPISGFVCYKIGDWLDQRYGTGYLYLIGLILGCAAGMYETFRQAVRIEGLDKRQ
jgi:F0F1-type ATP synthase assembly protein I